MLNCLIFLSLEDYSFARLIDRETVLGTPELKRRAPRSIDGHSRPLVTELV